MFKNYLKIAWRNLIRNKVYSSINIGGLAIGISAALVIYLIVQHEFSFEQFHKDKDTIFRVVSEIEFPDLTVNNSGVPVPTATHVKEVVGVENATHILTNYDLKVSIPTTQNKSPILFNRQKNIIYTDEGYFDIFQYQWLAGSPQLALKDPYRVVLTKSRARVYFPSLSPQEVLGKSMIYEDSIQVVVSGIVKDLDEVTDFTFKEFISRATIEASGLKSQRSWDEWSGIDSHSQLFIKLSKDANTRQIESRLTDLRNRYREKETEDTKDNTKHFLQPLVNIHFNPVYGIFEGSDRVPVNKSVLFSLLAIAAFLLGLGCINFINLTTAKASQRAKEIGIRKTLGGSKATLVYQFLSETFLCTLIATLLSVALSPLLMQLFRDFIPVGVSFDTLNQPHVWLFLIILLLTLSMLSGFYPAWVLSKFKPVSVLKNQTFEESGRSRKTWLRRTLTITQFVITQVLLVGTLAMGNQIHYSINKDLGYKKDAIVFLDVEMNIFSTEIDDRRFVLLDKLKEVPEIAQLSLGSSPPASTRTNTRTIKYSDEGKIMETMVETKFADTPYFDIYKMRLVAGSFLQKSFETKEYIINETYAKWLGFENARDAIGKLLEIDGLHIPIVGVVADFHTKSTQEAIKPLVFSNSLSNSYTLHIALPPRGKDTESWQRALGSIERLYKETYPDNEFNYTFFDASVAAFYKTEQNIIRLLKWATGLCMIISCLGLLGLVMYTTNQRTKEIGIRKVLGSSGTQIIALLSKDIIVLVSYAFVIATPISYWSINRWLQDYHYRVDVEWSLYVGVGFVVLLLSALTISFQTLKAANANPVKSLRTE